MIEIFHHKYYRKRMAQHERVAKIAARVEIDKKAQDEAVRAMARLRSQQIPVATVQ